MKRILPLLPALLFFGIALQMVRAAQGLPAYDYWEIFPPLLTPDGLAVTWDALYRRSNEHIVAVTKLFYLLNYYLTGGDNLGLSVIACLFSLVIASLLCAVISGPRRAWADALLLGSAIGLFSFTPLSAHNYLLGMSGVAWLGANVFLVGAAFAMYRAQVNPALPAVACALALGLLGGQSYSTGLMILVAVGIQGCMLPQTRRAGAALVALGIAYILIVYALQVVPAKHGARSFQLPQLASFVLTLIGSGLTSAHAAARVLGGIGIAAFLLLAGRHATRPAPMPAAAAFCIALACYALMNAGVAAIGRSGMAAGDAIALSSRYASLPSLFWIAVLGLVLSRCDAAQVPAAIHRRCVRGVAIVALAVALAMVAGARDRVSELLGRFAGNDAATLSLALGVHDQETIDRYVTPDVEELYALAPMLRTVHHIPFNGVLARCPRIGSKLSMVASDAGPLRGYIDTFEKMPDQPWYRVRGWALEEGSARPPLADPGTLEALTCVALVDDTDTVQGWAVGGMLRPDVAQVFRRERADFGWQGYAQMRAAPAAGDYRLHAAIQRQPGTLTWTKLPHSLVLTP